jgi:hypothetical protein
MKSTTRLGFLIALLSGFGGLAQAQLSQEIQQKVEEAKAAAQRNQQALRSYTWIATTDIMFKGEVKNTKVESCQYGPDGQVQKTELSQPPPQNERRRRGLRGRIVAKKTGEMKQELESAAALAHSYVPPVAAKLQAVAAAGKVSLSQAGPGAVALTFPGYNMEGDSLTLTFNSAAKALETLQVNTWLDDPSNKVTLEVTFDSLPDGTNYAATTVLTIPAKQIEVQINNSNYERLGQ